MDLLKKKQYGLVLKTKKPLIPAVRPLAAAFADDDDDGVEKVDVSYEKTSASTVRVLKQAERQHERALAEDPTIFDYDASYDEIQAVKNEKVQEQKKADRERKPKYAETIIKTHKRREIEKQSREERQQQKERIAEGEEFGDKEVFVTGAYRKQMEEVQKFREEEAYEARFNDLTSVEKQKVWQAGLSRTLLNDIARTGVKQEATSSSTEQPSEEKTTAQNEEAPKKKERHVRKRMDSRSPSPEVSRKEDEKPVKKSIYSDDEDDEASAFRPPPPSKAAQKNFEGELKPGLNRVTKKAPTRSDKLRERLFTPTPPSSDDESTAKSRRNRGEKKERDGRGRRNTEEDRTDDKKDVSEEPEHKPKPKRLAPTKEDKEARLVRIKEILKQRNGPEQIEEFRKRYLERRASGIVVPPL